MYNQAKSRKNQGKIGRLDKIAILSSCSIGVGNSQKNDRVVCLLINGNPGFSTREIQNIIGCLFIDLIFLVFSQQPDYALLT